MARLRAATWGDEEYWKPRIAGYMSGQHDPRQALKPRVAYVATDGGTVVGLIAGHLTRRYGCDGELQWIDVAPEHRGQGVASGLLCELAAWFVQQGALRVCVDVEPGNLVAHRFYHRHGAVVLKPSWLVWEDIREVLKKHNLNGAP